MAGPLRVGGGTFLQKLFFLYFYICKLFFLIPVVQVCQIYQKYIYSYEHHRDKNNKKLVQMSCSVCIVYTFHLSLHNVNVGHFKATQVFVEKVPTAIKLEGRRKNLMALPLRKDFSNFFLRLPLNAYRCFPEYYIFILRTYL